jgi:hypothetical protein
MSNLNLSLVAGYSVDSPALSKPVALPNFSLGDFLEGVWVRIEGAQRRRVEAEVARHISVNGGVITDEVERQISRRFGM